MTIQPSAQQQFGFMADHPRGRTSYRLTALLFLIGGLITGSGLIINALLQVLADEASRETYIALPVGFALITWTIMSACATYLTSAELQITDQYIAAHIIGPWTITLNHTDPPIEVTAHHIQLPYRRLADNERIFTIPLSGLRPAARLSAAYLGIGLSPMLFITPDHQDYESLVHHIQPDITFESTSEELS